MESLDYYSTSNTLNTFMTALFGAAAGVVAVISALIGIALYLLLAYAYYRMAKNRELPHAWTAWIPIAQLYLLMRVMRMLVSMIVMLVYCVAVREEARAFLLTFIANYLIYLIYDSWFFFTFEANRKLKKKSNNEKIA